MKVWIEGRVVDGSEARIPVTDHGLLYGDGVFEGTPRRRAVSVDSHLSAAPLARAIGLELPGAVEGIRNRVETARAFGQPEGYVRLLVTRGDGARASTRRLSATPPDLHRLRDPLYRLRGGTGVKW